MDGVGGGGVLCCVGTRCAHHHHLLQCCSDHPRDTTTTGRGGEGYVVELVILRLKAHSSTNINDEFVLRSHGYEKDIEVEEVSKVMHYA